MNSFALGHALADLANGDGLDVNQAAIGGYEQWLAARMRRALCDYEKLVAGSLNREAALRHWVKILAFATAHAAELSPHADVASGHDVIDLIERIIEGLEEAGVNRPFNFDPFCQEGCGADTVLDEPLHYCGPVFPEELDEFGYC
jgi:hypothetical protein